MNARSRLTRLTLLLASLGCACHGAAQNLPGVSISAPTASADVIRLFDLAKEAYPSLFSGSSGWREFNGYTYQYFSASRVYAGVKGGTVYLLGGPFGNSIVPKGALASAIIVLENKIQADSGGNGGGAGAGAVFEDRVAVKTVADISRLFRKVTVEYGSSIGSLSVTSAIQIEVQGVEQVGGSNADHLKITLSGSNVPTPMVAEMWVDSAGNIVKLVQSGFEYQAPLAQAVGTGLVSSVLLALSAVDQPTVSNLIAAELAGNDAVTGKVETRSMGGREVSTLVLDIGAANGSNLFVELTDFGDFTMATRFGGDLGAAGRSEFEIVDIELR